MSLHKKIQTELSIDWFANWIAKTIPGYLEILGGGPAGPGGALLSNIAKEASPAQKKMILEGAKAMADYAAKVKTVFAQ